MQTGLKNWLWNRNWSRILPKAIFKIAIKLPVQMLLFSSFKLTPMLVQRQDIFGVDSLSANFWIQYIVFHATPTRKYWNPYDLPTQTNSLDYGNDLAGNLESVHPLHFQANHIFCATIWSVIEIILRLSLNMDSLVRCLACSKKWSIWSNEAN